MSVATREILKEIFLTIYKAIVPNEMKLVEELIKRKRPKIEPQKFLTMGQ
jgi:hypothetical protein